MVREGAYDLSDFVVVITDFGSAGVSLEISIAVSIVQVDLNIQKGWDFSLLWRETFRDSVLRLQRLDTR